MDLRSMLKLIKSYKAFVGSSPHRVIRFPKFRNLIVDVVREGSRKHMIHALFDVDVTDFLRWKAETRRKGEKTCSLTTFISCCFAQVIGEKPEMQAYRSWPANKMIIFDEVDVLLIVEKKIEGADFPWIHTIRSCERRTVLEVEESIRKVRTEPLGKDLRTRVATWLTKQPEFIRKWVWFLPRNNPYLLKYAIGTVAVTSFGMHARGHGVGLPITPMTLTLAVGSVDKKLEYRNGVLVERDYLSLNISADHDVIDGAPLARFVHKMNKKIANPLAVVQPV